jgi:hypothetical protein
MKKIAEILGLGAEATEEQIVDAVAALKKAKTPVPTIAKPTKADEREKAINEKIAKSGGALNREQAAMAIDHQAEADKQRKAKE